MFQVVTEVREMGPERLLYIYLAVHVLSKNPKSLLNISCAAFNVGLALWSFGYIFVHNPNTAEESVKIFMNISSLGYFTFGSNFLCFALIFSKMERLLKSRIFHFIAIVLPLSLIYTQWTSNQFVADYVKQSYGWSYIFAETVWPYIYYIYYSLFMLLGFSLIYRFGKKTDNLLVKKQAKIMVIFTSIAFILGSINSVIIQELNIHSIPSMANIIALVWASGLVYAITKYNFLTITVAIAANEIIDTMTDYLIVLDKDKNIAFVNYSLLNMLGKKKEELTDNSLNTLQIDTENLFKKLEKKAL